MGRSENAHLWLAEPLTLLPSFIGKRMFGCDAVYAHGLLMAVFADGEHPWNGLLVPTEHEHQGALMKEFPSLSQHPVLKKWLYLSAELDNFEIDARTLVQAMCQAHPRMGVPPQRRSPSSRRSTQGEKPTRAR